MTAEIITLHPRRSETVASMAKLLIEAGSYQNNRDAAMTLLPHFRAVEIAHHLDDARQVAMQEAVVAAEMST